MGIATKKYQSTTVRIPSPIYERAKAVVEKREYASSLNELMVDALEQKLTELDEAQIDAAFAQMADDPDYQRDAVALTHEFAHSDWDAFQVGQKHESATRTAGEAESAPSGKEATAQAHAR